MKQDNEIDVSARITQALIAGLLFGAFIVYAAWQISDIKKPVEKKDHNDLRVDKTSDFCKGRGGLTTVIFVRHDRDDAMTAQCCSNSYQSSKKRCIAFTN